MLLGPSLIGSAVCNFARIACLEVVDRDPAHVPVGSLTMEGDPVPIGRPRRIVVIPALGRVGDLADTAPIGVHREERTLRASANRRVSYVSRGDGIAFESL